MKPAFLKKWILFILPFLYLLLSIIFLNGVNQFYISNFDSSYSYLMNGTNIASGHLNVGNLIHPGTPVEIFAAIVIFIKHLFAGPNIILYQDVLLHPESYLFTCCVLLAVLLSFVTYFAGTYIYCHTGNILLALLFQMSPLFYNEMVGKTILLSAESSITISGIFFVAYLYVNTIGSKVSPKEKTGYKNDIILGVFTALLVTTKIYCAPIILLVVFLLKEKRKIIIYLVSSGFFSLLLLFPLWNQSKNWAGTIKGMIFHRGAYGQGSTGVINASFYKNNIIEIFSTHYIFTTIYILVISSFLITLWGILKKRISLRGFIFPITGIVIFFTLFILIVAKQYKVIYPEPFTHKVIIILKYYYFIPIIIFFPFFIAVSYKMLSPLIFSPFFHRHIRKLSYGLLVIFIAFSGLQAYASCHAAKYQGVATETTRLFLDQHKDISLIIVSDGNKVCIEPALFLGIAYSGPWGLSEYTPWVKKQYPNTYLYTTYDDALIFWDHQADISTILKKNKQALVYFSSTDSISEAIILSRISDGMIQKNKVTCSKIYSSENKYEDIYLLKADSLH